jgi:hypothetical protein
MQVINVQPSNTDDIQAVRERSENIDVSGNFYSFNMSVPLCLHCGRYFTHHIGSFLICMTCDDIFVCTRLNGCVGKTIHSDCIRPLAIEAINKFIMDDLWPVYKSLKLISKTYNLPVDVIDYTINMMTPKWKI